MAAYNEGLVLVIEGMQRALDAWLAAWNSKLYAGLMQGVAPPHRSWSIANIEPATFPGYGGLQQLLNWKPASLLGELAVSTAGSLVWAHSGGLGSHVISGWYAVDAQGKLHMVEQFPRPWQVMAKLGDRFTLLPTVALGSRYPVER